MIKFNPITTKWGTWKLENHISFPTKVKVLSPISGFPPWGYERGVRIPRESDFKSQQNVIMGLPENWWKERLHTWTHKTSVCTRTKGKWAVTSQKTESNILPSIGGSSTEERGDCGYAGTRALAAAVLGSTHWYEPSWSRPLFPP